MHIIIIFRKRSHVRFNDDGLLLLPFYVDSWYLLDSNVVHNNCYDEFVFFFWSLNDFHTKERKSHHNTYKVKIDNICIAFYECYAIIESRRWYSETLVIYCLKRFLFVFNVIAFERLITNLHRKIRWIQWDLIKSSHKNSREPFFSKTLSN